MFQQLMDIVTEKKKKKHESEFEVNSRRNR